MNYIAIESKANAVEVNIDSITLIGDTSKIIEYRPLALKAVEAVVTTSTGKDATISTFNADTANELKTVYMKQDSASAECVTTIEYVLYAAEDMELDLNMLLGHRSAGTYDIANLMKIYLKNGTDEYRDISAGSFTSGTWTWNGTVNNANMVPANIGSITLKQGENRIKIVGNKGLYLNIEGIVLKGDTTKVTTTEP